MKPVVRHIAFFFSALLVLCGTGSCIFKRDYSDPENDGKALFVLHIAPVNTRTDGGDKVTEKIKSLRVIAVGKDEIGQPVIEINRKATFDDIPATDFSYAFTWRTKHSGAKDFYIIANEEKVSNINGTEKTLSDLLDSYKAVHNPEDKFDADKSASDTNYNASSEEEAEARTAAKNFKETIINTIYFQPGYEITDNSIFLPYSTCYENVELTQGSSTEKTMYLVPVATKFYFRFYNYHKNDVKIQKLTIEQTDSENFLLGKVGEEEQTKEFNSNPNKPEENKSYYWVDWLAKVAEETHKNLTPDNSDTNDQYGWISDYSIPETTTKAIQTLIGTGPDIVGGRNRKDEETIPAVGPLEDMAGELYLGPYYFPESRVTVTYTAKDDDDKEITVTEQRYTLGLKLHDTEVDSTTSNDFDEQLVIENVRSLFRDTCVLIQISMRQGDVDVYAEMAPWVHKEVAGWADGGSILN